MTTVTNAAVVELTATSTILKSDPLLKLIIASAPPYQLNFKAKDGKGGSISLKLNGGTTVLTQRNAILRSICGMGLHNALDLGRPHYLLGGHSAASLKVSESALVLAGISSWMSVADSIRASSSSLMDTCCNLDEVLLKQAYLCPSVPQVTLADLDVFYALVNAVKPNCKEFLGERDLPNLERWLVQCRASIKRMIDMASEETKELDLFLPELGLEVDNSLPVFFYGDEEDVEIANTAAAPLKVRADQSNQSAPQNSNKGGSKGGGGELTDEQKKAAAEKRAKKNAEKAAKKKASAKGGNSGGGGGGDKQKQPPAELNISALDIRVGKIIEAWPHEESDKLYCEKVDVGEAEPRQIISGLRNFYKLEEMQNRMVLVLCNLKKRNMVGVASHGMVLCASNADHTTVEFVIPPDGANVGERVLFEGYEEGMPEPENKVAKKKMFEKLAPGLKTDGEGVVVWKNGPQIAAKSSTSAGPCIASKGMKDGQVS